MAMCQDDMDREIDTGQDDHDPYEGMTDDEICRAEEQNEYRLSVQERNRKGAIPFETDTTIGRYFRFTDCTDEMTADVVVIDRLTGDEVMRYDGADPANTNPYYGATDDGTCMANRGLDIAEVIVKASVDSGYRTNAEIMARYPQWYPEPSYDDDYDWEPEDY